MVQIIKNTSMLGLGVKTSLSPVGGVGPYIFSILPNGAGGTLIGGQYTAPFSLPSDASKQNETIQVVDSLGAKATTVISILSPMEMVCDIIRKELGLSEDQVYIYNQKFTVPNDSRLYICVGLLNSKPFSNTRYVDGETVIQSVNIHASLSISVMSKGSLSRNKKEEVIMALGSIYAEKMQEANNFYIAKLPSGFLNITDNDGMAMVNHYNTTAVIQYAQRKVSVSDYFDTFTLDTILTN